MAKAIFSLCFFVVVFSAAWSVLNSPKFASSPCKTPIAYQVGRIDPQFKISSLQASAYVKQAVSIWNQAWGKPIFVSSSPSAITVNFVYDERTALNSQIISQEGQIEQDNATLQKQISQFESDKANYEKRVQQFNQSIAQYNQQGYVPPDKYDELIREQKQLVADSASLSQRAAKLNLATKDINSQISNFNEDVTAYNAALSQKPEAGLYNTGTHAITIYFAQEKSQLLHTLAHEFGHALSLPHSSGSADIMYSYTTPSIKLSANDMSALAFACRPRPLSYYLGRNVVQYLYRLGK